jgi:hypothetical protein
MAAGTYNATVEVSGTGITNKTFSVSFVVRNKTDAEITLAGIETLVETTIGGSPNVLSLPLNPTFVSLEEQVKFLFTKLKLTETYEIDLSGSTGLSNWKGYNGNIARIVKLTLPNSVTTIDTAAFSTYQSPKEVIGNYVRWIGDSVFYGSSILEKVSFPYVETIGTEAFSYCINLDTADFSSANSIGNLAFRNCIALTSLKLKQSSSSPTMLGSDVFAGTNSAAGNLKINVGTANIAAYQSSWGNIPVITTEFTNTAKFGTAHRSIELTN